MNKLPAELILNTLKFVSKQEVHALAHVSRRLRSVAVTDKQFFITYLMTEELQFERLAAIEYATAHRLPLAVHINNCVFGTCPPRFNFLMSKASSLIVEIRITVPLIAWGALSTAMSNPAPSLRYFRLDLKGRSDDENRLVLHKNLFSGVVPNLDTVELSCQSDFQLPTILKAIKHLTFYLFFHSPDILVAQELPMVERLTLTPGLANVFLHKIDCRGAHSLHQLDLSISRISNITTSIWDRLFVRFIPIVTISAREPSFPGGDNHPLLSGLVGPLAVRTVSDEGEGEEAVVIRSLQVQKQLVVREASKVHSRLPQSEFRGPFFVLFHRLVDVDIDSEYLVTLLDVPTTSLPMLERLRIRIRSVVEVTTLWALSSHAILCDHLAVVTLTGGDQPIGPDFVSRLSGALGQTLRPLNDRARLRLVGEVYATADVSYYTGMFGHVEIVVSDY